MATKRIPIKRAYQQRIGPELRAKIDRLIELRAAHHRAIQGKDGAFYSDGRHRELVELIQQVYRPLGIRPWDRADAVDAKLAEAEQ